MAFLGSLSYVLSVGSSLIGITFAILYFFKKESSYALLAIRSVYANAIFISIATLSLIVLLLSADFSVVYVANHVNHALPYFYRFTSVWAGQAGSLLWWNFLLSLFSAIALSDISKREAKLIPGMIIVLLLTSLFFTVLGSFTSDSDPFVQFVGKQGNKLFLLSQNDGRGLNPLLQHWAMIIHPPILYLGYVSFAVPFAIAMSVLMLKNIHIKWIPLVRRWTLFSWGFLGFGILLGGKWAYEELGWGGYWAWDPVENAALMPWLTGTAFLHSVIVQERRNMLKVWNMTLVTISFLMCIFGTFLTRSGVVSSVHAFASSNLGPFFTGFMALMAIFSLVLILSRYKELKSDKPIESFLSREAGFLFNNVILLIALFTVIWGTMYPVFTEAVYGEKVSVTAVWFNRWMSPLGLAILFLTGIGPLLSWRRTSAKTLWRNLRFPLLAFLIISIGFFLYAKISLKENHFLASLSFGLSAFVMTGVLEEFYRATKARISVTGENIIKGFIGVLFQNKRRYLGYAVHFALAIMFVGFTGKIFTDEARFSLAKGESARFHNYIIEVQNFETLMVKGASQSKVPLYYTSKVTIDLYKNNRYIGTDTTEVRQYPRYNPNTGKYDENQQTSEPFIISKLDADFYIQYAGMEENRLVLQVWLNPLVKWVWIGFGFFVIFSLFLLLPIGEKKKKGG